MSPVNLSLVRPVCGIGISAVSEGSISGLSGGLESSESMGSVGGSAARCAWGWLMFSSSESEDAFRARSNSVCQVLDVVASTFFAAMEVFEVGFVDPPN